MDKDKKTCGICGNEIIGTKLMYLGDAYHGDCMYSDPSKSPEFEKFKEETIDKIGRELSGALS